MRREARTAAVPQSETIIERSHNPLSVQTNPCCHQKLRLAAKCDLENYAAISEEFHSETTAADFTPSIRVPEFRELSSRLASAAGSAQGCSSPEAKYA